MYMLSLQQHKYSKTTQNRLSMKHAPEIFWFRMWIASLYSQAFNWNPPLIPENRTANISTAKHYK